MARVAKPAAGCGILSTMDKNLGNRNVVLGVAVIVILGLGLWYFGVQSPAPAAPVNAAMRITSRDFVNGGLIPVQYTCDGSSTSPQLSFEGVPRDAKSLALLMFDPDVPKTLIPGGFYDHWVVFNIPPTTAWVDASGTLPGVYGANGSGKPTYAGPCPPDREHRYFFDLYALDEMLGLKRGASKGDVLNAMQGHILSQAELIGRFNRQANVQKAAN